MATKQPVTDAAKFLLTLIAYVLLTAVLSLNIISLQPTLHGLYDFGSFIAAGKESINGRNPYTAEATQVYHVPSEITGQTLPSPNLNPPLSVVFFKAIANADPMQAASNWRITSAILFAIGILTLGWYYQPFTTPLRILWAICLAGFWITISIGQIYAPLFLLTMGAWILMEKGRTISAGVLLGALITIKPNFAFWLLLLGVTGYTQTILSATITITALSIAPILILGSQVYQQWIAALLDYPSLGLLIAGNCSLQSLTTRLGNENLGIFLSLILAVSALYYAYRNKTSLQLHNMNSLGLVTSILISPFSWPGYTAFVLPIFFSKQHWNWPYKISAACLAFPYLLVMNFFQRSLFDSILFGWLYGWALLLILIGLLLNSKKLQFAKPLSTLD